MAEKQDNGTTYLGDGLYAEHDGFQVKLFAHDGIRELHAVYLDSFTLETFENWIDNLRARGVVPPRRK